MAAREIVIPWDEFTLNPQSLFFLVQNQINNDRIFFTATMTAASWLGFYGANWFFGLLSFMLKDKIEYIRFQPQKHAEKGLVRKAKLLAFFYMALAPVCYYFAYPLISDYNENLLGKDSFPTNPVDWVKYLLILVICNETGFYWSHRFLHIGFIYRMVHKMHHNFKVSIGYAAIYAHPVEMLLSNILPVVLPAVLLKLHLSVMAVYVTLALVWTVKEHSGVMMPWDFSHAGYHDWHHEGNVGNYGVLPLWDVLMGTTSGWKKQQEKLKLQFYSSSAVSTKKQQ